LVVGYDYVSQQLSTVMGKYIQFYNDPMRYRLQRSGTPRFRQVERGEKSFEPVDIQLSSKPRQRGSLKYSRRDANTEDLRVLYPVQFKSKKGESV